MPYFLKRFYCVIVFTVLIPLSGFAQSKTDSLLAELKKAPVDSIQLKILLKLSTQNFLSNDSSLMFVKQAALLAEKMKSNESITKAQVAIGMWYLNHSNSDTAVTIWHHLYERMKKENYLRGMATAYRFIGKAFLFNASDSAIYYNIKSIELFKELNDSDMVNSIKINLAVVYAQSGREQEGIALTKEGMEYADRTGNIADAGTAAVNVGYFYEWIGNPDSALVYFQKNIFYNTKRGDPVGAGHGKSKVADVLFMKKKYDEAFRIYQEVLKTGKEIKSDRLLNYSHNGIASIALVREQWDDAINNFNAAYSFSSKNKTEEIKLYESLYKAYKGKKDFKKALDNYVIYIAARDTFNNAERLQKVDELEAKYQNKEKQSQIELLNKENKIQQDAAERQLFIRNTIIIISIILFIAGLLLFNRFKLKKRIENQQTLLNERNRIARDLHDDVGATLSSISIFSEAANQKLKNKHTDEAGNLMERISSDSQDMVNVISDFVWTLNPANDSFQKVMDRMQSFASPVLSAKNMRMDFETDDSLNSVLLKPDVRKNVFLIFKEAVNNAAKYSGGSHVQIRIKKNSDKISMTIKDDGKGFDKPVNGSSGGNGIKNMDERAVEINSELKISSDENGTMINLEFLI
ncbi:MAG: histidine kinase [Bacteroidota bacterium]